MFRLSLGANPRADRRLALPTPRNLPVCMGRGSVLAIAIIAMVQLAGCNTDQRTIHQPASATSGQSVQQPSQQSANQAKAESNSEHSLSVEKSTAPKGPISVDGEGFVTLETADSPTVPRATSEAAPIEAATVKPSTGSGPGTASLATPVPAGLAANAPRSQPESVKELLPDVPSKAAVTLAATPADAPSGKSGGEKKVLPGAEHPKHPPAEAGIATFDEKHQKIAEDWPKPQAVLCITGQQHGYIEPCGCTGLENQKGGLNRRDTLMTHLKERGWDIVPMDVGNFERRLGRQAEIKFQTTVEALNEMQYRSATLGIDDLKLSSTHLLSLTASEGKTETPFVSANAHILVEEYMPKFKVIEVGGRKLGVTAALGDHFRSELTSHSDIVTTPAASALAPVVSELKRAGCDYLILLAHASLEESQQLARDVPGFDLVVTAGGYPEPPFQLEAIEGSTAKLAQVGAKGMYTVLIGLYPDPSEPVRYQRVALSSQFHDSPRMLERFSKYQKQLEALGFEGLGLREVTHPSGRQFVGSAACGECHTRAFEVWKNSEHFQATQSLVKPPNDRSMIPRHFDPECLSCHVTGWNAQNYYPYASGYHSLERTPSLTGNGCENCHGPGSAHVAAENGDIQADAAMLKQLQEQMRLPLAEARARCMECHDQDNSPEFQHEGSFEKYWQQIAHPFRD